MRKLMKKHPLLDADSTWLTDEPKWYMLYVKSGELKKVADDLNKQGVFTYRALTQIRSESGKVLGTEYVFPKNTFVFLSRKNLLSVPMTREKVSFVYQYDNPVVISDVELEQIHSFVKMYPQVELSRDARLAVGLTVDAFSSAGHVAQLEEGPRLFVPSLGCTLVSDSFERPAAKLRLLPERRSLAAKMNTMIYQLFNRAASPARMQQQ